ncbi:monooxygenase [Mycobacteroides abscessus subsp. abscessus]|nr:monooxygenase [Mycobacteroides abscessus subsp. abscessus]
MDARPEIQESYNQDIQRRLQSTTWNSGCQSWYLTDDGFNATMFPGFATQYVKQLKRLDLQEYRIAVAQTNDELIPTGPSSRP